MGGGQQIAERSLLFVSQENAVVGDTTRKPALLPSPSTREDVQMSVDPCALKAKIRSSVSLPICNFSHHPFIAAFPDLTSCIESVQSPLIALLVARMRYMTMNIFGCLLKRLRVCVQK